MALAPRWAGRIAGTSTGNLFLKLAGEGNALEGELTVNEDGVGLFKYNIHASYDGLNLHLVGEPLTQAPGINTGKLKGEAKLNTKGELEGDWATEIGSAGIFKLYPHWENEERLRSDRRLEYPQIHSSRYNFRAVELTKDQLIELADRVQKEFLSSKVVVTVNVGTVQARFLDDFRTHPFNRRAASFAKIFAREADAEGLEKIVHIEFGPLENFALTQSPDEPWVVGRLEILKNEIRQFERIYATGIKTFGFDQLFLIAAIAYLPSLSTFLLRIAFMAGVILINRIFNWAHGKFIPLAIIYLMPRPLGVVGRLMPPLLSWGLAVSASLVAALLAAVLTGWLGLVGPN